MPRTLLRTVPVASGQMAVRLEKARHHKLRAEHPDDVVAPEVYRGQIKVKSEIYDAILTSKILAELDCIVNRLALPA